MPPAPKSPANHHRQSEMTLGDHLEDLRRRVILALIGVLPILVVALIFGKTLLAVLIGPLREQLRQANQPSGLLATGPFETFAVYLQISLIATVIVGSPWLLYHLWKFVEPGLYTNERSFVYILVPLSSILTLTSAAFLYYVVLPVILAFFINFGTQLGHDTTPIVPLEPGIVLPQAPVLRGDPPDPQPGQFWVNTDTMQMRTAVPLRDGTLAIIGSELVAGAGITQQYRVSEYIKTVLNLALAFGIGFQTPVVVLLLGWAGIVEQKTLAKYRRYAVAISAVAGAILTPADPLSMMLLAIPLYVLYELGMLLLVVFPPKLNPDREPDGDADDDSDPDPKNDPDPGPDSDPEPDLEPESDEPYSAADLLDKSRRAHDPNGYDTDPNGYDTPPRIGDSDSLDDNPEGT